MSKKVLVVFGATGNQGSSIIDHVTNDSSLSSEYAIRAITRNTSSAAAQALQKRGFDVMAADIERRESLKPALAGAHTVIAITVTDYTADTYNREFANGKAIADAAVDAGAQYLIFSTLPPASEISDGKYRIDAFDSKANVEKYIRGLPIRSAFFAPGFFMENFAGPLRPQPAGDGTFRLANINKPETRLPLIATRRDVGKFVAPILADPNG